MYNFECFGDASLLVPHWDVLSIAWKCSKYRFWVCSNDLILRTSPLWRFSDFFSKWCSKYLSVAIDNAWNKSCVHVKNAICVTLWNEMFTHILYTMYIHTYIYIITLGVQHHWEQRVLVEPPLFAMGVWPPRPGSLAHRTSFFTINPGCSPSALPNSYRTQNQTQRVKYFRMLPSQKNGGSAAELTCCNYTVVQ